MNTRGRETRNRHVRDVVESGEGCLEFPHTRNIIIIIIINITTISTFPRVRERARVSFFEILSQKFLVRRSPPRRGRFNAAKSEYV